MILVPVIGFKASGKTTLIHNFIAENGERVLCIPHRLTNTLTLIATLTECENCKIDVVIFEFDFTTKRYDRLTKVFRKCEFLPVLIDSPMAECANRLVQRYANLPVPKDFSSANFFEECRKFKQETRDAVVLDGARLCIIPQGLPFRAAVGKLKSYINTAIQLKNEKGRSYESH